MHPSLKGVHMVTSRAVKLLSFVLACCTIAACAATEPKNSNTLVPADAKRQVLGVEKAWVAAEMKRDAATLRRILDDKFIVTFGARKPYHKEVFIKQTVSIPIDPTETQRLTGEIVIVDGDTAVVVGTDTLRGTERGKPYMLVARYTTTYVRRDGQWLALAEHLVEVPQAKTK
jgi:ketosteroid isomerase-like protein